MEAKHSRVGYMIKLLNPNKGTVNSASDPTDRDHVTEQQAYIYSYFTLSSPQTLDSIILLLPNRFMHSFTGCCVTILLIQQFVNDYTIITCTRDYKRGSDCQLHFFGYVKVVTTKKYKTVAYFHNTNHSTINLLGLLALVFVTALHSSYSFTLFSRSVSWAHKNYNSDAPDITVPENTLSLTFTGNQNEKNSRND